MRYAIAKALVYSLMQDAYFASISEADKAYITGKILDDVKGRMLEDIVLLEVRKTAPSTMEAFKFKFDAGGEFDMVITIKQVKIAAASMKSSTAPRPTKSRHFICVMQRNAKSLKNALARSAVNSFFIAEKIRLPRVFSI